MTSRPLIITSLLLFATLGVRAQINESADDYFNGGAQYYISNNIPDALKRVETGLKIYPEDVKLKKLEELLKQQQNQQKQQQNQSQNQKSQSQNQQQKQNPTPQQQQSQQNQQNQANSQKQQEQQAQAQAMTPEEAKRLLDAQKGNEQLLKFNSQNQPQNANPPLKDW